MPENNVFKEKVFDSLKSANAITAKNTIFIL